MFATDNYYYRFLRKKRIMSIFRIAKNTIYYGVVPKLTILMNIVILPLITPYLTTYDYGIVGVVTSYTGIMLSIAPLGMNIHLTNSFFEIPKKYQLVWGRVYSSFLFSGLFFGIICVCELFCVLPFGFSLKKFLLCIFGTVQIFLFAPTKLAEHLFPYVERPKPLVLTTLFSSLCGIMISFMMIYYFRLGFWGLIASTTFSSIFTFSIFGFILFSQYNIKPIIEKKISRLKSMLRDGLPLVPHTLGFMLLSSSARIIMSIHEVDYNEIGLFSHGCQMGTYVVTITTAFVVSIAPMMQRYYRNNEFDKYRKLYYLAQSVSILAAFVLCLWMKEIYVILINNDSIRQSSSIATLMCFAQALLPLYNFMSVSCFVDRKTKQLLWLVFVPGIINLVMCYFLIPYYGIRIAAYSTMVSYWAQLFMPFVIPYFKKKTTQWLGNRFKLIIAFLCMFTFLVLGNVAVFMSISTKILISFIVASLFCCYYKKLKFSILFA